jgi:cation/acetate symporter
MIVDPYVLSFSLLTVIATILMGFWAARKSKTAHDFYVAGRSVSVGWNASAISGEYLSAASFMGVAGMVMSSGYDALWYPVCYACGYLFLLLFIAGPLRRFGAYTIPDFAEGRYDSPLFRKIAVVFVLFIGFFYTMPQMKGAGTTLAYIFPGLPYWAGVVLVGAVITLNVALGGMKGITLVQAVQYWAKMFAISVPIFVLMAVYGNYGRQLSVNKGRQVEPSGLNSATSPLEIPKGFVEVLPPQGGIPLLAEAKLAVEWALKGQSYGMTTFVATDLTNVLAEFGQVIAHVQVIAAEDLTSRKLPPFKLAAHTTGGVGRKFRQMLETNDITLRYSAPACAWVIPTDRIWQLETILQDRGTVRKSLPSKAPADDSWLSPFGPLTTKAAKAAKLSLEASKPYSLVYTYSLIIALVCGTAGLPHILVRFYTNPDGVAAKRTTMWVMVLIGVFYMFPPVFGVLGRNLLPDLYAGVGAKGTDKVVLELPWLLNEKHAPLGSILSGITCAGAFAAFMSTFSGLLVSMTGALAHDVYGKMLRPKSTPNERMRAFKVCTVVIGVVAILLGMQVEPFQINFMVGQAFAIAAASYFPLLFMSAWWRGMTMKGAATGMLAGGLLALAGISLTSFSDLKWLPLDGFWMAHPLLRILCEQPAIWAVPLAIALMVFISKLTKSEIPSDIRMKMLVLHAPEKLGLGSHGI